MGTEMQIQSQFLSNMAALQGERVVFASPGACFVPLDRQKDHGYFVLRTIASYSLMMEMLLSLKYPGRLRMASPLASHLPLLVFTTPQRPHC
jgi:hypothetical protein